MPQELAYALLAAASPVVLLATLVVLGTGRARLNGVVFAGGFLFGQALGIGVPLLVGVIITSATGKNGTVMSVLELAVGVLALFAAGRMGMHRSEPIPDETRAAAILVRLERVTPTTAFSTAVPLGIGAKRLVISILAASAIAQSTSTHVTEWGKAAVYVVIATVLVWVPVAFYVMIGQTADAKVGAARRWLIAHQRQVSFYLVLAVGLLLTLDAAVQLLQ